MPNLFATSPAFPEPNWGTEQAPSLDVARVRVRVSGEEVAFNVKKAERDALRKDVTNLDTLVSYNTTKAAENRTEAEAMQKDAEKTRAEESLRKAEIAKAAEDADLECQEVEKLRDSIKDLTATQEKNVNEQKLKLDNDEGSISTMEAEIASTLEELAAIEKQSSEHKESEETKTAKANKELKEAEQMAGIIKRAYEKAQKDANDFSALPDGELAFQMKQLDEAEQDIIDEANRERAEIIESKYRYSSIEYSLILFMLAMILIF